MIAGTTMAAKPGRRTIARRCRQALIVVQSSPSDPRPTEVVRMCHEWYERRERRREEQLEEELRELLDDAERRPPAERREDEERPAEPDRETVVRA
jgi:hypothetical protein